MRRRSKAAILGIVLLLVASILPSVVAAGTEVKPEINVEEMQEWGYQLSDSSMCPRMPGTIKDELAAQWVADKFESFGLETWIERTHFQGVFHHRWELKLLSPEEREIVF